MHRPKESEELAVRQPPGAVFTSTPLISSVGPPSRQPHPLSQVVQHVLGLGGTGMAE
jgi:hypothetical protein